MSDLSNYLENALMNHLRNNTAFTMPATLYLALFTAFTDLEAGTVTEATGNGYARQAITLGAPANGVSSNSADILFPVATPAGYTVVAIGIYDAAAAGNLLFAKDVADVVLAIGDQLKYATGALTVGLA